MLSTSRDLIVTRSITSLKRVIELRAVDTKCARRSLSAELVLVESDGVCCRREATTSGSGSNSVETSTRTGIATGDEAVDELLSRLTWRIM